MYGCERETIKKAQHGRIDAFELLCWWRHLRVPWITRRLNQSILKEISPEYSLEGRMLKLKLQYFGHLMRRTDSLEKTLMLGKIESRRRRGQHRMRWFDGITISMDLSFEQAPGIADGQGSLLCFSPWGCKESDMTEQLNWLTDWHENISLFYYKDHNNFFKKEKLGHKLLQHIWQISILPESICPYIFMKQVTSRGYQNHVLCPVSSLICSCPGVPILSAKTSGFSLGLFPPCLKLTVHRNRMLMRSSS